MLKSYPFQENFLELFVEYTIDQSIHTCRKVDQDNYNIVSIFHRCIKKGKKDTPDAVKRVTGQENCNNCNRHVGNFDFCLACVFIIGGISSHSLR